MKIKKGKYTSTIDISYEGYVISAGAIVIVKNIWDIRQFNSVLKAEEPLVCLETLELEKTDPRDLNKKIIDKVDVKLPLRLFAHCFDTA